MFVKIIDEIDFISEIENGKIAKEFIKEFNNYCRNKTDNYNNNHLFTPSTCGNCARNLYYKSINAEKDKKRTQPFKIRRLDMGTYMHKRTEDYLHAMSENSNFKVIGTEITKTCEEFLNLGGTVDALLDREGDQYIFEYKTINEYEFSILEGPLQKHIEQAIAYSLIFKVNKALFLYEKLNKTSNQDIKVFVINISDTDRQDLLSRIITIEGQILIGVVPDRDKKRCRHSYCEYKNLCENN